MLILLLVVSLQAPAAAPGDWPMYGRDPGGAAERAHEVLGARGGRDEARGREVRRQTGTNTV